MIRKIKALGLASVAAAAMSVVAAASVQASELHVAHQGNAVITGSQTQQHVLTTSAGTVTCSTATFEGALSSGGGSQITAQELTLTPTYSGCQAFGLGAQVRMNGCKFRITWKGGSEVTTAGTWWVHIYNCTFGKVMEVNAGFGGCIMTVPEQNNLPHIIFTLTAQAGIFDFHGQLTFPFSYEMHGALCGHPTTVVTNNGTYAGQATIRIYASAGTEQVTQHGHQFLRSKHSNEQVNVTTT
jgi:hypothetical protein